MKRVHFVGIGGIGISALARYYLQEGFIVSGSDKNASDLTRALQSEGVQIVDAFEENIFADSELYRVIYTEGMVKKPPFDEELLQQNFQFRELQAAHEKNIELLSYPQALAQVVNAKSCIAVAGSHGKSTTTSMLGVVFQQGELLASTIVGTILPQFGQKNFFYAASPLFVIEACEYKRSFLQYFPEISIILNIDLDHLDYYHDLADYISAFQQFANQTKKYTLISGMCKNSQSLQISSEKKVVVYPAFFEIHKDAALPGSLAALRSEVDGDIIRYYFPEIILRVPGEHIAFDAKFAFTAALLAGKTSEEIVQGLQAYQGAWRRSEIVAVTENDNIVISDYGHHPTEIAFTLDSLKKAYPDKKMIVAFQPHQYSRTRLLLSEFSSCFSAADKVVVPNIYFSRDTPEDVASMPLEHFVEVVNNAHGNVYNGQGMENTLTKLKEYDNSHKKSAIIVLMGAGDIDNLRHSF